jgi:hypothetical protein
MWGAPPGFARPSKKYAGTAEAARLLYGKSPAIVSAHYWIVIHSRNSAVTTFTRFYRWTTAAYRRQQTSGLKRQ